ncbi:MAG: DUF3795 domain-containing protein, partial [Candidatus Ranarchaeia archaeon]
MREQIAMCGVNCSTCPSYRENLQTETDQQECSDGWHKYLGFRLSPSRILQCDGCLIPNDENPVRYFKNGCYIRKCGEKNGVSTCAHCSGFPCEDVTRHGLANTREKVATRLNLQPEGIPQTDYERFIEPYESFYRLEEIRRNLSLEDIVPMGVPLATQPQPFPKYLRVSKANVQVLESIHRILSEIIGITGGTYARETTMKKRKQYLLKFLWTMSQYGELQQTDPPHLAIESKTYFQHLKGVPYYSNWEVVKKQFNLLKGLGIQSTVIPLTAESWISPKG